MPRRDNSSWQMLNAKPNLVAGSCSWRKSYRNVATAGMETYSEYEYIRGMKYILKTFLGAISLEPSQGQGFQTLHQPPPARAG